MKRYAILLLVVMLLFQFAACGKQEPSMDALSDLTPIPPSEPPKPAEKPIEPAPEAVPEKTEQDDMQEPTDEPEAVPEPEQETETEIEPEPEPEQKNAWTLCFAGDCTIGTLHEWQGQHSSNNMLYVIGDDYAYPFSGVSGIFDAADFTMVNLEGTFTNETAAKGKDYRFRSAPDYAAVLPLGNVDAVTLANNHSGDYLNAGLADTKAALEENGILWADDHTPLIVELEGGLKLGFVTYNVVEIDLYVGDVDGYMAHITPQYNQCVEAACDLIIGFMHWGWEYTDGPEDWMVDFAHRMADMGFDMVVGSHAHILQETEYYNGVPIFYSLGNFCYGGHSNPKDKDTVIVRQNLVLSEDGTVILGETEFLPCSISSDPNSNNFCPTPYQESDAAWNRILGKLHAEEFYTGYEQ